MKNANRILVAVLAAAGATSALAQVKTAGPWEFYGRANVSADRLDDDQRLCHLHRRRADRSPGQ
jgi:hypothetical protein